MKVKALNFYKVRLMSLRRMRSILIGFIFLQIMHIAAGTCVLESEFGFIFNCNFKKSGLFRVRNLGGLKAHFGLGFSLGDELGLAESLGNLEGNRKRSINQKTGFSNKVGIASPHIESMPVAVPKFQRVRNHNHHNKTAAMTEVMFLPLGVPTFRPIPKFGNNNNTEEGTTPKPTNGDVIYAKQSVAKHGTDNSDMMNRPLHSNSYADVMYAPKSSNLKNIVMNIPKTTVSNSDLEEAPNNVNSYNDMMNTAETANSYSDKMNSNSHSDVIYVPKSSNLKNILMSNPKPTVSYSNLEESPNTPNDYREMMYSQKKSNNYDDFSSPNSLNRRSDIVADAPKKPTHKNEVMNAPKEYYPSGYDKNFDDNFKTKVELPPNGFSCAKQKYFPGLYANKELGCMVFHVCAITDIGIVMKSFLCPESTLFDQTILKCNWWFYVDCNNSNYDSNIPVAKSYNSIKSLSYFSNFTKSQSMGAGN